MADIQMGIHLPLDETSSSRFSAEEREMRTRLYWSGEYPFCRVQVCLQPIRGTLRDGTSKS